MSFVKLFYVFKAIKKTFYSKYIHNFMFYLMMFCTVVSTHCSVSDMRQTGGEERGHQALKGVFRI